MSRIEVGYYDVLTVPELAFRFLAGVSAFTLTVGVIAQGREFPLLGIGVMGLVMGAFLTYFWNEQYELSTEHGVILNRIIFGIRADKTVLAPEQLGRVSVNGVKWFGSWSYCATAVGHDGKLVRLGHYQDDFNVANREAVAIASVLEAPFALSTPETRLD